MPLAPVPAQAPASAKPLVPYKDSYVSHDLSSLSIYDLDDVIVDDSQRAAQVDVAMASSLSIQSMAVDASSWTQSINCSICRKNHRRLHDFSLIEYSSFACYSFVSIWESTKFLFFKSI